METELIMDAVRRMRIQNHDPTNKKIPRPFWDEGYLAKKALRRLKREGRQKR